MFAGIVGNAGLCGALERLSEEPEGLAGIPFDERAFWRAGDAALLQQRQWTTPELRLERGVLHHPSTGVRIAGWLRIDNRQDLRRELAAHGEPDGFGGTDGGLVLLAWLRWGEALCEHLVGDFAFALYDPRDRSCLLARDPMGVKPLYYVEHGGGLAFATGLHPLAGLLGAGLTLNEEWLARYVSGCASDSERTIYREARKVPPAHQLRFRDGRAELRRYFAFDLDARDDFRSSAERLEAYRALLTEAAACRVHTDGAVASELSGGLDSSSVTAFAALAMPDSGRRLHGLGFANLEQEPQAILSVSQTVPLASTQIITPTDSPRSEDIETLSKRVHRHLGSPLEHANAVSHIPIYELAVRTGARMLLSGFGGDEFVTVPGARAAYPEIWRAGRYAAWMRRLPGNAVTRGLRAARWWWRYRRRQDRFAGGYGLSLWVREAMAACPLSDEMRERHGIRERMEQQAGAYDLSDLTLREYCLRRWQDRPGLVSRLENCTHMGAAYGLEYRWPLLDVRVLAFFLAVPAEETVGPGGMDRYFHRQASAGVAPDLVVWKDKAMGQQVPLPERWRRRGGNAGENARGASRYANLQFGDLNPVLRGLLDPERFERTSAVAAKMEKRVANGAPARRSKPDWGYVSRMKRQNVVKLDRWLSDPVP